MDNLKNGQVYAQHNINENSVHSNSAIRRFSMLYVCKTEAINMG